MMRRLLGLVRTTRVAEPTAIQPRIRPAHHRFGRLLAARRSALSMALLLLATCTDMPLPTEVGLPTGPAGNPLVHADAEAVGPVNGVHALVDDFAGSTIDAVQWLQYGTAGWIVQDDRLEVLPDPGSADAAGLRFQLPHVLAGNAFAAEISRVAGGSASTETFISLVTENAQEFVVLTSLGGKLVVLYQRPGEGPRQLGNAINLHATNHRFRRIREQGGTLTFQVSANGTSWTTPSGWSIANFFTDPTQLYGNIGVRARDGSNGAPTPAYFENVNTTVPAIPRELAAVAVSQQRIDLAWQDRSVNESGFRIERRAPGGAFAEVATAGANVTQYQDTGLAAGTTYEYRVRAYNGSGNSAYTATVAATTEPPSGPSNPSMHDLVDEFVGSVVDTERWTYFDAAPQFVAQDDRLVVTLPKNVPGYGGLMYRLPHRFVGTAFSAEVSQVAAGGPYTETFIGIATPDEEEYVVLTSLGGKISAWRKWRDQPYFQVGPELNHHAVNHRFRRLREHDGVVYFEVSVNGTTWSNPSGWSVAHAFTDVNSLHGLVGAGAYLTDATAGTAIFENVNTTVPAIPRELTATAVSSSRIDLAWQDRSVNESGFRVERRTAGGTFEEIATVGANATQYQNHGLAAGTVYEYRVRAYNGVGTSGYTNSAAATTQPPAGQPPVADAGGPYGGSEGGAVPFDGTGSYDPDGTPLTYSWSFGDGGGASGVQPTHTYADNGTYVVVLTVTDGGGLVGKPDTTTATITNVAPTAALSLSPSPAQVGQSVGLTGTFSDPGVNDAPWQWQIDWGSGSPQAGSTSSQSNPITASRVYDSPGTYTVQLRVTDKDGGVGTATRSLVVEAAPPPAAPSGLTATSQSTSRIDLQWQDNSGDEQGFELQRSAAGGTWTTVVQTGANVKSHSDTNLQEGVVYGYRVRAFSANGASAWSNEATTATRPAAPTNLVGVGVSSSQIDLSWTDNSNGELGYQVYRSIGNAQGTLVGTVGPNVTTFSDTGLASNRTYFYGVVAFNLGGVSEPSNPASARTLK